MKARKGKPILIKNKFITDESMISIGIDDLKPLLMSKVPSSFTNFQNQKLKDITSISITSHAWERWNERVTKIIPTFEQLQLYLTSCIIHLGRVRFLNPIFASIDEDIIFHYETKDHQLFIISFYGRITNKPGLSDVNLLLEFLGKKEDRLSLFVPKDQLINSIILPIPSHHLIFAGTMSTYELNVYRCPDGVICHLINPTNHQYTIWNLNDPDVKLSKSTITALKYLRLENYSAL